ncbi:TonB-dependent receptor [Pedobacter sp. HMWF019]|uniref:TonB-dependent receptor n=1 Tax=Pedobacter sp. HMWF019 TaxID=2056856 RepID=UPI000D3BCABF|nr:TonB-dependent receptor plug domain-containing protein [Pedobacter sp. HMWF019]PTT02166.1 TonB-dependent receptor [Pedobacter sp. HMWF019]
MIRTRIAFRGDKYCFYAFLAILWCHCIRPEPLFAQTDSLKKANELKEVKIRAIKLSRRQTSSTPLQILSGADLEKLNSLSVADAVRFFSGVQLKDYGGIGGLKTINVRSMGTNHTAVFYDGVPITNAQNGQVDLGKFSLDNIEEIELYSGQKSEIFQSARGFASASSIYLNTLQPKFEKGEEDHFKLALKTGSFGLLNPSLLWQHKLNDRVSASLSTEYTQSNGRYKFRYTNGVYDTTAVRNNGDVERMRVEAGLNGVLPDSSTWNAKVYFYKDQMGLPGPIIGNRFDYDQRSWSKNLFVQSSYEKKITDAYRLKALAKYSNDYTRYLDPDFVNLDGLLNNRFHQHELYLSVANQYKINSWWTAVLSGDYQLNTLDANLDHFPYPTRNTFLLALATQLHFDRLDIQANLLGTFVNDKVKYYTAAGNKQEFTPTLMLSWQPFEQKEFRIRSFFKSIFRMPTFNDLYYTLIGRTSLKPEYTKQYDLGFTYAKLFDNTLLRSFSLQTDAYFNRVKDKIIAVPGNNGFRWSMKNLNLVDIKGIDVNMQSGWSIAQELQLNMGLTYTYQQAQDVTPGTAYYKNQIPYIPLHSGSLMGGAQWRNYSFNYSYIYTSERYNQAANIPVNYVKPWYTHDIAFHYNTLIGKNKVRLTAEVNNLFNQYYDVVENFPMPGRSYRFTLSYQL